MIINSILFQPEVLQLAVLRAFMRKRQAFKLYFYFSTKPIQIKQ